MTVTKRVSLEDSSERIGQAAAALGLRLHPLMEWEENMTRDLEHVSSLGIKLEATFWWDGQGDEFELTISTGTPCYVPATE